MDYRKMYLKSEEVLMLLQEALNKKQPFSLIRIGDGEGRVIAHDLLFPTDSISPVKRERLLYAGARLPDYKLQKKLIWSMKNADVVGFSGVEGPGGYPLLSEILKSEKVPVFLDDFNLICSAYINMIFWKRGYWPKIWDDKNLLVIGRRAEEAIKKDVFKNTREVFAASIEGFNSLEGTLIRIEKIDFDLALVSAGVVAPIICSFLARLRKKVAFDFGHLLDCILEPDLTPGEIRIKQKRIWEEKRGEKKW